MQMKLYLAGPMRGYEDHNFPAFHMQAKLLRDAGYEVFSPAEKGEEVALLKDPNQNDLAFRRLVFKLDTAYICDEADGVALMTDWQTSLGAQAENALALAIGLPSFRVQEWLMRAERINDA
jgi:nucleoside 2-deoxyribosyltransferase